MLTTGASLKFASVYYEIDLHTRCTLRYNEIAPFAQAISAAAQVICLGASFALDELIAQVLSADRPEAEAPAAAARFKPMLSHNSSAQRWT